MNDKSIIIGAIIALINILIGYYISNSKHAFKKIYELKLKNVMSLYGCLVKLDDLLNKYVLIDGPIMNKEYKDNKIDSFNDVFKEFNTFRNKYRDMEIIFDEDTNVIINDFINEFVKITAKLAVSNKLQEMEDFNEAVKFFDNAIELLPSLIKIKDELKKEFKRTLNIIS